MITWKIPVFCCFTKKAGTNRSSFSYFYSVYFSVLSLFSTFHWKKHTNSYFFCFHRTKKLHVYSIFLCLNFSILHNFTFFSKLYSLRFSYFLMVYLDVRSFVWYNKCQKTIALIQLANKEYEPFYFQMINLFSNDKAYRRTPYVSQKDP